MRENNHTFKSMVKLIIYIMWRNAIISLYMT